MIFTMGDTFVNIKKEAWTFAVVAGLILACSGVAAEMPNPDPQNISRTDDGMTVRVSPRNDTNDYTNLQWAFDHAAPGGTVMLDAGTFDLGDGAASPRRTVVMRKGLRVIGTMDGEAWTTIVRGGGEVLTPGVGGPLESGPIRIVNDDDLHPAIIEGIWFREWAAEVIFIEATHGFELRDNRISHPANRASPGIRFVHALWSTGVRARGDFIVEDCLVEMGGYESEQPADDEQFMGVFYANHDTVRIVNNVISGIDETIEIIGNRSSSAWPGRPASATKPAEIIVSGNRVVSTGQPGSAWPHSFAILILGNLGVDLVRVDNNHVTKSGDGWGMGLSGENFHIFNNAFRFEKQNGVYPPGAIIIGGFGKLGTYGSSLGNFELGNSLVNSLFEGNTFEGKIGQNGILFWPGRNAGVVNNSHGNHFELGEGLASLGAQTTLFLGKDTDDNSFGGDLGTVVDQAPVGANAY